MNAQEINSLRANILKGIELSFNKLLLKSQKENGELVVSQNGKVARIKAKDLKMFND